MSESKVMLDLLLGIAVIALIIFFMVNNSKSNDEFNTSFNLNAAETQKYVEHTSEASKGENEGKLEDYDFFTKMVTKPGIKYDDSFFGKIKSKERQKNSKIEKIVIHNSGQQILLQTLYIWKMKDGMLSAHYLIDEDGTIYYIIDESQRANHVGCLTEKSCDGRDLSVCVSCVENPSPATNENSIGIVLINARTRSGDYSYTEEQYKSLKLLIEDVASRRGINLQQKNSDENYINILGHCQLSTKAADPGSYFKWEKIGIGNNKIKCLISGGPSKTLTEE